MRASRLHRVKRRHVAPLAGVVAALFLLPLARLVLFAEDAPGRVPYVVRNVPPAAPAPAKRVPAFSIVDPAGDEAHPVGRRAAAKVKPAPTAKVTIARAQHASPRAVASAEKADTNALLRARSPSALDEHAVLLEDSRSSEKVREAAAHVLGSTQSPQALALLLRATSAPDPDARRLAARALGQRSDSYAAFATLQNTLSDSDPSVRIAAASALGSWPDAARALEQRLACEQRIEVKLACLDALGRTAGRDHEALLVAWSKRSGRLGERATSALAAMRARLAEAESLR